MIISQSSPVSQKRNKNVAATPLTVLSADAISSASSSRQVVIAGQSLLSSIMVKFHAHVEHRVNEKFGKQGRQSHNLNFAIGRLACELHHASR